jgi:hypothetical protein
LTGERRVHPRRCCACNIQKRRSGL